MSRILWRACAAFILLYGLLPPLTASAHEHITVGSYELAIGWVQEPVLVGERNGLDLFISPAHEDSSQDQGDEHQEAEGVTGAESALGFSVEYGGVKQTFELRPVFGEPGHYTADIIPTVAGQYTFHFTGSINGEAVEASIDPEEVADAGQLAFPEPVVSASDLVTQLESARAQASAAQTIGIIGLVLGLVGTGLGVSGLMRRKSSAG